MTQMYPSSWTKALSYISHISSHKCLVWGICLSFSKSRICPCVFYFNLHLSLLYRRLRSRRALTRFIAVQLRTRRALSSYTLYSDSILLVLSGTMLNIDNTLLALNWWYNPCCIITFTLVCSCCITEQSILFSNFFSLSFYPHLFLFASPIIFLFTEKWREKNIKKI